MSDVNVLFKRCQSVSLNFWLNPRLSCLLTLALLVSFPVDVFSQSTEPDLTGLWVLSLDLQGGTWELDEANMVAIAPDGEAPPLAVEQNGNILDFLNPPETIELSGMVSGDSVTINQHQVLFGEETASVYDATVSLSGITMKGRTDSGSAIIEGTYTGFGFLTRQYGVDESGEPIFLTDNCTWFGTVTGYIILSETIPEEGSLAYDLSVKRIDMVIIENEASDAMETEFNDLVVVLEDVNDPSIRNEEGRASQANILVVRNDARHGIEEILEEGRQRWRDRAIRGRPDQIDRIA
ncbi:MAG: hypothetical protein NUW37_13140, partial [Planctomycetes bacterium]|nr:hypothetical protein [Planctomycetota bacterium]